ncbi:MAG TPA: extracellular solute-binding protein [Hansschlegelia sp.]
MQSPWSPSAALSRRRLLQGAAAIGAASAVGGVVRPAFAADPKRVSYVGWEGYDSGFHVGSFLADNNATIDTTYINTSEDMTTKLRSGGVGTVDLTTYNHMYNPLMGEAGLLTALDVKRLPSFDKLLPQFKKMAASESDGTCYGVPFTFSSCALLYNPKKIPVAPTSWKDFLKPEYKGKVALFSDMLTNILVWAPVATGVKDPTRMNKAQLDQTIEMLITLKKDHVRAMPASLGDGAELLIRGEADMIMGWEPMVSWCKAKDVEVKIAKPVEGTWAFVDTFNIAKGAPNLELDYAFVEQAISVEAQAAFGNANLLGVVNADAVKSLTPEVKALYDFDNLDAYFQHARIYPRMFGTESDGEHVTYDEVLDGYERFLKA